MVDKYLTVNGICENLIVIEKSKFICYIKGINSENDAKSFIDEIKKKNSMATHNCYAYIADEKGLIKKFSDDGEPQGTAGLPMLEVLQNSNLKKVVSVVTRYFGGIKLGVGGLSRAYGGSVSECLKKCEKVNYELFDRVFCGSDEMYAKAKEEQADISNFEEKIELLEKKSLFVEDQLQSAKTEIEEAKKDIASKFQLEIFLQV